MSRNHAPDTISADVLASTAAVSAASNSVSTVTAFSAPVGARVQNLDEATVVASLSTVDLSEPSFEAPVGAHSSGHESASVQISAKQATAEMAAAFRITDSEPDIALIDSAFCAIEVFGGCARLTFALTSLGLDCTAIDWLRNMSKPQGRSVLVDVTTAWGYKFVSRSLAQRNSLLHSLRTAMRNSLACPCNPTFGKGQGCRNA